VRLTGLPFGAALDALDAAPFPCTLVLQRLPALAAAVAANAPLALPKPLWRGPRVRVGCFTGAPEAERDPVRRSPKARACFVGTVIKWCQASFFFDPLFGV
jgi:hypothetical protein